MAPRRPRGQADPVSEARRKLLLAAVTCLAEELSGTEPAKRAVIGQLTGELSPWQQLDATARGLARELHRAEMDAPVPLCGNPRFPQCAHSRGAHFRDGCDGDFTGACPCTRWIPRQEVNDGP